MERAFSAPTEAEQDHLYRVVSDLGTYPDWLAVVRDVEASEPSPDDPDETVWTITLRARIGPLARSKRLRMVRTVADGRNVRFERRELDGRQHSIWILSATVEAVDGAPAGGTAGGDGTANADGAADGPGDGPWRSQVTLDLHYGGSLWSGLLDAVLQSAAEESTERLQAYVAPGEARSGVSH